MVATCAEIHYFEHLSLWYLVKDVILGSIWFGLDWLKHIYTAVASHVCQDGFTDNYKFVDL